MELFFIGMLTGIVPAAIIILRNWLRPSRKVALRQSLVSELARIMQASGMSLGGVAESQSRIDSETETLRFVQAPDDKVYWIENKELFCAEISGGYFEPGAKASVNTKNLSKNELHNLLIILDTLQNG